MGQYEAQTVNIQGVFDSVV